MSDNIFKEMLKEYKKVVQIPFEEYKEKTKKDKKEVFQFMVHKMANDDIKLYESLETSKEYIDMIEEELEKYKAIIKEVREYIKENTTSYYTDLEHTNEEFELIGDPKELLEILEKVDKDV